jgi:hypothetical protein
MDITSKQLPDMALRSKKRRYVARKGWQEECVWIYVK